MLKRLGYLIGAVMLLAALLSVSALAATAEQVQITMPNIDLYFYADGTDLSAIGADEIAATLGDVPLTVDNLTRDQQGVFYVYLLDISASMPKGHFDAVRQAIKDARAQLRSQDQMALISFGSDVQLLLHGGERTDEVAAVLDGLQNADHNTMFYSAMDALIKFLSETSDMRRVAVVVSDGIDDTDAGITQQELEDTLLKSGISVSALCIDTASAENQEQFERLLQISGGALYPFGADNAGTTLTTLLTRLSDGYLLELTAPNNLASDAAQLLRVDLGQDAVLEMTVKAENWVPDETPPAVVSATLNQSSGILTVKFSEAVAGADQPDCYILTADSGATISVTAPETEDGLRYTMQLAMPLPDDQITLELSGITDVSMERNPLSTFQQVVKSAVQTPAEETQSVREEEPLISTGTLLLLLGAVVLVIVAILVILRLSGGAKQKKPKEKKQPKEKSEKVNSSATFVFMKDEQKKDR